MHKLEAGEIVGTTFYTIQKISEHRNGGDALLLYFSYIKQTRIQQTNQTWSTDVFMMKMLGRGDTRMTSAKKTLKTLGLIDIIQTRDEKGRVTAFYVKVNFLINEEKVRTMNKTYEIAVVSQSTPQTYFPTSGQRGTNALSIKDKCLKQKSKNIHALTQTRKMSADEWRVLSYFGLSKEYIELEFKHKKPLSTLIKLCESVKRLSSELDIEPIYDRECLNATDIMLKKYTLDEIYNFIINDGMQDYADTYKDLIRLDYYLPEMMNA